MAFKSDPAFQDSYAQCVLLTESVVGSIGGGKGGKGGEQQRSGVGGDGGVDGSTQWPRWSDGHVVSCLYFSLTGFGYVIDPLFTLLWNLHVVNVMKRRAQTIFR